MSNTDESELMYYDILNLVNELFLAGAEAISINDERVVAMTDIKTVGSFILVNRTRKASPYTIKAIGDTKYLESALMIKGGYYDTYKDSYSINIQKGNVIINKYDGEMTLDYVTN